MALETMPLLISSLARLLWKSSPWQWWKAGWFILSFIWKNPELRGILRVQVFLVKWKMFFLLIMQHILCSCLWILFLTSMYISILLLPFLLPCNLFIYNMWFLYIWSFFLPQVFSRLSLTSRILWILLKLEHKFSKILLSISAVITFDCFFPFSIFLGEDYLLL